MSQYIGHSNCYDALERILRQFEAGGYTRLVPYGPGETALTDSKPAPDFVPGVQGKKQTGVDYEPQGDGSHLDIFYVAKERANAKAIEEAKRSGKAGMDGRHIVGTLVSIKRLGNGNIQLLFTAANRDHIENGVRTDKAALRSLSVAQVPAENSGTIVAMGINQGLGVDENLMKQMADAAGSAEETTRALSQHIASARDRNPVQRGIPEVPKAAESGQAAEKEVK